MFNEAVEVHLAEAKQARAALSHKPAVFLGIRQPPDAGLYLSNYANCLLNRQIDIFDDSLFLLESGRISSACVISRGMIETYAFAKFMSKKIDRILAEKVGRPGGEEAVELVLKFTNSSRIKESEQKKVVKGIINPDDYMFTDQAKNRLENLLAGSQHVMNALRDLYQDEVEHTKQKESQFEFVYDGLSEWVHPSQTSIFHHYVPETHSIPTSIGVLHLHDGARMACVRALHFITDSMNIHAWTLDLAQEITRRCKGAS